MPDLVVEPRQDARHRPGEKWPHFPQRRPHRLVDLQQIEADHVPVGGHRRLQREVVAVGPFNVRMVNGVRIYRRTGLPISVAKRCRNNLKR